LAEYIKSLRGLVGHIPLLQCGASIIVFNKEEKVLMIHRTDDDSWCFPGGSIELGEKVEEAAKREVLEETGLVVDDLELFGVFSGKELYHQYPNGDQVYNVAIVYRTNTFTGELLKNTAESKDCRFFDINELPEKICPPELPTINKLKQTYHMKVK
jgi:mutator protein MutT